MVTIKEIAEELGVSTTTVSNVIHGKTRKMSADTRKRIEEALVHYHYVADYRTEKETEELKFILVSFCLGTKENILMDPFCGEMLGAIEKELHLYQRNVWYDSSLNEDELIRKSQAFQVEGVLFWDRIQRPVSICQNVCQNRWSLLIQRKELMIMSAVRVWMVPEAWQSICSVRDMKKLLFFAMNGWIMEVRKKSCRE